MSRQVGTCQVDGCDASALARGWCNKHYLRWKNHGDPAYQRPTVCSVEGCERPVTARGWCSAHYLRWRRTGRPEGNPVGQANREHDPVCSVDGCERPYYGLGLCRKHYDRQRQAGSPTAADKRFGFDIGTGEFWNQLDHSAGPTGCWTWKGARTQAGYGTIQRRDRAGRETILAHRLAWTLQNGEIPDGLYVCHRCDNPPCCNPTHLFLGTHADNMADMSAKRRGRGGNQPRARNNAAKLTEDQVAEIRRRVPAELQVDLAREFGVNPSTISRIVHGRRW